MLFVKYLFTAIGFGFVLGAAGILIYDLYLVLISRWPRRTERLSLAGESAQSTLEAQPQTRALRWGTAARMAAAGVLPILLGMSITVVPSGEAGVRINFQARGKIRCIRECTGSRRW